MDRNQKKEIFKNKLVVNSTGNFEFKSSYKDQYGKEQIFNGPSKTPIMMMTKKTKKQKNKGKMVKKRRKDSILTKFMIWVLKIKGFERWVLNLFLDKFGLYNWILTLEGVGFQKN